jgi:hypothetical protein
VKRADRHHLKTPDIRTFWLASTIGTVIASKNAPYIKFVSHFPSIDYLSPLRNKADRNQRDPGNALVIAFDTYSPNFLAPDLKHDEIGEELKALYGRRPPV